MRRSLLSLCLLLLADRSLAADGVIEINEVRALAGGVSPGDEPGYPVLITEPGAYRLTGNLDVGRRASPQDITVIRVEASDVDIDLAGFAILGPASCGGFPFACAPSGSGIGILAPSAERVRVHGGAIRGMGSTGVLLGPDGTVESMRIAHCARGGIAIAGSGVVAENTVALNGGPGINASGVIRDNSVRGSIGIGIHVTGSAVVRGNVVETTTAAGLNPGVGINAPLNTTAIIGNSVHGNAGVGLALSATSGFASNAISGNNGGLGNPPQTSGGVPLGPNLCGNDTTCP